jgi:hypothetical protein
MASGVEDGTLVCSTGKISRLIGTLDGIDATAQRSTADVGGKGWNCQTCKTRTDSGDEAKDVLKEKQLLQYIDTPIVRKRDRTYNNRVRGHLQSDQP